MTLQRTQGLRAVSAKRLAELEAAGQPVPFSSLSQVSTKRTSAAKAAGRWVTVKRSAKVTGPTREVVDLVLERDHYSCVVCGDNLHGTRGRDWSIHHRRLRGMGGDTRPDTHLPQNLIAVCGADNVTGCHGWIHSRSSESEPMGLLLSKFSDPLVQAMACWYGAVLLNAEGGYVELSRESVA